MEEGIRIFFTKITITGKLKPTRMNLTNYITFENSFCDSVTLSPLNFILINKQKRPL